MSSEQSRLAGRRATIIDVADAAGVSKSTVSRVLSGKGHYSEETKIKIRRAAKEVGYTANTAARSLRADNSHIIGLLLRDAHNPVYGTLHRTLQQEAYQSNQQLMSMTVVSPDARRRELEVIRDFVGLRVGAIMVASGTIPSDELVEIIQDVPTLVIGRPEVKPELHNLAFDELLHGQMIADRIHALGYRKAIVVTLSRDYSHGGAARTLACADQLRRHGIEVVEWPVEYTMLSDADLEGIINVPGHKALVVPFDRVAIDVMRRLDERGIKVPEDVGLASWDGMSEGIDLIGLTTVRMPVEKVAHRAMEVIQDIMREEPARAIRELYCGTLLPGRTLVEQ